MTKDDAPILMNKHYDQPTIFNPEGLLREARRQKGMSNCDVPRICVLDPDGDLSRYLRDSGAPLHPGWACYHTEMFDLSLDAATVGVIGCAVGASFAVLVAEQLFVSGCRLLISVTSAGQLVAVGEPPYFILIDRSLRDEGTSYHYLPPSAYARLRPELDHLANGIVTLAESVVRGGSWTTDAPYRETAEATTLAKAEKLLAVEMEAAALYAFAEACKKDVICFAHVTNRMATIENDFEKGDNKGNTAVIKLISSVIKASGTDLPP
jgi:uridine phosphorylase